MLGDGRKCELVDGQLRSSPTGHRHGRVCTRLGARLRTFAEEHQLGCVLDSSTGFRLPGGNIRVPDVTFIAKGRYPGEQVPEGFGDRIPDLVVEVLSPDDRSRDILEKVGEYLQAGVHLVWVIDLKGRTAAVHSSSPGVRRLGPDDWLEGGDVLPGFRCRLADLIG